MGRPKAWLPVGEHTMLEHVVEILARVVEPIAVVAAPDQDLPPLREGVLICRDQVEGRGPLQGLAAGLRAVVPFAEAAYVSGCDVPLLRDGFVRFVIDSLGENDIAVPFAQDHYHPLAAVYRTRVVEEVDRLLAAERLRPFFLFEAVQTHTLSEDELRQVDPKLDSLRNLNTPEDYRAAMRDLGLAEP